MQLEYGGGGPATCNDVEKEEQVHENVHHPGHNGLEPHFVHEFEIIISQVPDLREFEGSEHAVKTWETFESEGVEVVKVVERTTPVDQPDEAER